MAMEIQKGAALSQAVHLVDLISRRFLEISLQNKSITDEQLRGLYEGNKLIFTSRSFKPGAMEPSKPQTWKIMFTADNAIDSSLTLDYALRRIERVIDEFNLFSLENMVAAIDDISCVARLREILVRIEKSLRGGGENDLIRSIKRVFVFTDNDIHNSRLPRKKYFGYRRSANSGEIVRFFIEIKDDLDSGLVRFDCYFRRHPSQWTINGPGFAVGDVTYLMGNAKSSQESEVGRGVRFFTLQSYDQFGWLVGLLDTRDNRGAGQPIAAKIVLVPSDQHTEGKTRTFDPANEEFIKYISEPVNPSKLEDEVKVPSRDEHLLKGLSTSELIQALIWNGSLRTLHGEPQPIPEPKDHLGLRRLLKIQSRVLELHEPHPNDISMFVRLLSDDKVYNAIASFLEIVEGLPKPPPAP